jgi:UDP-glucose 4-epimerase
MDIRGKRLLLIGGAGLIGSHTADLLTKEDVGEILIYDNFVRGTHENLTNALRDPRVKIYDVGGDVCQTDILHAAMKGVDGVFHLAALWLLQRARSVRRQ